MTNTTNQTDSSATSDPAFPLALNVQHPDCHKAADAFWAYWNENGETHKRGYYESTWGAINRAIRTIGVVPWTYGQAPQAATPLPGQDERALFEHEALRLDIVDEEGLKRRESGEYVDEPAQAAWAAWQAARDLPLQAAPEVPASEQQAKKWTAEEIADACVKAGLGIFECNALIVRLKGTTAATTASTEMTAEQARAALQAMPLEAVVGMVKGGTTASVPPHCMIDPDDVLPEDLMKRNIRAQIARRSSNNCEHDFVIDPKSSIHVCVKCGLPRRSREAAPQIKTWQERIVDGAFYMPSVGSSVSVVIGRSAEIAARDAEIADLRAALARQGAQPASDSLQTPTADPKA